MTFKNSFSEVDLFKIHLIRCTLSQWGRIVYKVTTPKISYLNWKIETTNMLDKTRLLLYYTSLSPKLI